MRTKDEPQSRQVVVGGMVSALIVILACIGAGAFCTANSARQSDKWEAEVRSRACEDEIPNLVSDEASPVDRSLLTGESCEPPCWYGITPGESTIEEAENSIFQMPFVQTTSIERGSFDITWTTRSLNYRGHILADPDTDIVETISYPLEYRLSIQDLIDRFGPPDFFSIDRNDEYQSPDCDMPFSADCHTYTYCYSSSYFWIDERLWVSSFEHDERKLPEGALPLSPNDVLYSVRYTSDTGIASYLEPWPGFNNVKLPPLDP